MRMNVTITGEEISKNSWQFFITVQVFENETQKLKMVQFGYWECIVTVVEMYNGCTKWFILNYT